MIKEFRKLIEPLANRVKLTIGRAALTAVTEGGARQFVKFDALKGETKDNVERVQQYGFTSSPLSGAQVVFVCVGGNRDHPIAISVDDPRHRLVDLQPGEAAIYNNAGAKVVLKADGSIEITAPLKVRMVTPNLEVTGEIKDRCDSGGSDMHTMREVYDGHHHPPSSSTDSPMGG